MIAIIRYRDTDEIERLTDPMEGTDREIIDSILREHDADMIWLFPDDADIGDCYDYYGLDPAWQLNIFWITRADGKVAKVGVGDYGGDTDFWTAVEQQYPEAYDLLEPDMVEGEYFIEYSRWDARFEPGEGKELAAWIVEGAQEGGQ